MGTEDVYEKHEERKNKLKELSQKVQYGALLGLASKLGISAEDLLRILAEVQGIDPELGRKIDLLWEIEFGSVKIEVAKPFLNQNTQEQLKNQLRKCRTETHLMGLEHGDIMYIAINHRDVRPYFEETETPDLDVVPVVEYINDWVTTFFRRKDKAMKLVKALRPSMSTHYGHECPESRYYEFELIDNENEETKYRLIYSQGKIVKKIGNLPAIEIAALLKKIGKWEK